MQTSSSGAFDVMLPMGTLSRVAGFFCLMQGHFLVTYSSISHFMKGQ